MSTTHKEIEDSYIFTYNGANKIHDILISEGFKTNPDPIFIKDYYLDNEIRFRQEKDLFNSVTLCSKDGNKNTIRTETNIPANIDPKDIDTFFNTIGSSAKLKVIKNRYFYTHDIQTNWKISVDYVQQPAKLAIFEIERDEYFGDNTCSQWFSCLFEERGQFIKCPLNAVEYFNRKIGICGAPSSGKSETAKIISHKLNTQLGMNSFHVTEYATSFIQKYKRPPSFADQILIWLGQHNRENDSSKANIILSDCPSFLSYIYMLIADKPEMSEETSLYMSKIYKRVLFDMVKYTDMIFLELQDYNENGIRYQSPEQAMFIEKKIKEFLVGHNIKYNKYSFNDVDKIINDLFYLNF